MYPWVLLYEMHDSLVARSEGENRHMGTAVDTAVAVAGFYFAAA